MKNDLIKYTLAALCAGLVIGFAGCGGGGGGGGGTPASPDTVSGTVTDNSGNEPSGDVVKFDDLTGSGVDGTVTETSGSTTSGTYTLTVPVSDITGSDYLWIFDSSGNLLDLVAVTVPAGSGQTVNSSPTLPTTPPNPPGNCFGRRPC